MRFKVLEKLDSKLQAGLLEAGATFIVTDINEESLRAIEEKAATTTGTVQIVANEDIYSQEADIFVPCAFGGIINDNTIAQFKVKAIAGSANNQLLDERHGKMLKKKEFLYAPDYIINSGGLIQVADELYGINHERVLAKTKHIYDAILEVYKEAASSGKTTDGISK